jgi:hypothetical protein
MFSMNRIFNFLVLYTNDVRQVEVKARSEKEAIDIIHDRAKRALMRVVSIAAR